MTDAAQQSLEYLFGAFRFIRNRSMNPRIPMFTIAGLLLATFSAPARCLPDDSESQIVERATQLVADAQGAGIESRHQATRQLLEELAPLSENDSDLDSALKLLSWVQEYDEWQRSETFDAALSELAEAETDEQRQEALVHLQRETLTAATHLTERLGSNELDVETVNALAGLVSEVESSLASQIGETGPAVASASLKLVGSGLGLLNSAENWENRDARAIAEDIFEALESIPGAGVSPLDAFGVPQGVATAQLTVVANGYSQAAVVLNLVARAISGDQEALAQLTSESRKLELTLSQRSFVSAMVDGLLEKLVERFPFLSDALNMYSEVPVSAVWYGLWSTNWELLRIDGLGISAASQFGINNGFQFVIAEANSEMIRGSYKNRFQEGGFTLTLNGVDRYGRPTYRGTFARERGGEQSSPARGFLRSR